ncbi:protein YLS7-like [Durio zibethinus]|uniref:Protein YLS7-like n=1 Tax=Durio zibethinus TaxID=66656 RepID=A0A6P5YAB5_DURZI|nr:protein YLS7-like [Durio zibethinus]
MEETRVVIQKEEKIKLEILRRNENVLGMHGYGDVENWKTGSVGSQVIYQLYLLSGGEIVKYKATRELQGTRETRIGGGILVSPSSCAVLRFVKRIFQISSIREEDSINFRKVFSLFVCGKEKTVWALQTDSHAFRSLLLVGHFQKHYFSDSSKEHFNHRQLVGLSAKVSCLTILCRTFPKKETTTLASPKGFPKMAAFSRSLSSIAASVVLLAMFLIFASCLLPSYPISSTVKGYFYGVDRKIVLPASTFDQRADKDVDYNHNNSSSGSNLELHTMSSNSTVVDNNENAQVSIRSSVDKDSLPSESNKELPSSPKGSDDSKDNEMPEKPVALSELSPRSTEKEVDTSSSASGNASEGNSVASGCDLYHGNWFYDPQGPLYTNNSCPVLTQMQNCQGNGRTDKEYENWRWKPSKCDLPRFDAKKFLELMRGKTLAFIGDSVARNQMESMLCLLWQVEVPKNQGNRRMQRWYFRSTSVMIVRIWSSWLVHQTSENFDFAPEGVTKLHLDAPDNNFMEFIPKFDVIVISSGHWFAKQSVYILSNEIVGGQLWWPDRSRPMKVNNIDAFGISIETILSAIVTHPNYTGLTIVRSFSPDHYEGGAWNTGGSCTGKVKPLATGELVENGFTNIMHNKQLTGFERAVKKATNKSKLRLMDITEAFGYRHDGHPGPYRNPDPNKITKRGPDGKPPPQDCLHWCMPGPVDTWNELVLEIVTREFEGDQNFSS